jgi:hypothetical protein
MVGLVPATPIMIARPCPTIGVVGTSPAMSYVWTSMKDAVIEAIYRYPARGLSPDRLAQG